MRSAGAAPKYKASRCRGEGGGTIARAAAAGVAHRLATFPLLRCIQFMAQPAAGADAPPPCDRPRARDDGGNFEKKKNQEARRESKLANRRLEFDDSSYSLILIETWTYVSKKEA